MDAGSPWSTPTESELGAAEAALFKNKEAELFEEIDFKVNQSFVRELGDGEPSLEHNTELEAAAAAAAAAGGGNGGTNADDLLLRRHLNDKNALDLPDMDDLLEDPASGGDPTAATDVAASPNKRKPKKGGTGTGSPQKKKGPPPPRGGSPTKKNIETKSNRKKKKSGDDVTNYGYGENDDVTEVESPSKKPPPRSRSESPAKSVRGSPKKRNAEKLKKQKSVVNNEHQPRHPPTAGSATSGESVASLKLGADYENMNGINASNSATTVRTAATDLTNSSGSSGGGSGYIPRRQGSPSKSPRKTARSRARDVLTLPKPYDQVKSDVIKKWLKALNAGETVDPEVYPTFKDIRFCNALILKVNQLCKQGLLDRKNLFTFAVHIAQFTIGPEDWLKCQTSFFSFARELSTLRDGINTAEQKEMFDLETASWIPPTYPRVINQMTTHAKQN